MLLFKKKFLELIRRGEKTQTIRLWTCCRMKAGQRSYIPGIGYILVNSVEQVELRQLTETDARLDGFPTADLLRKEIRVLYNAEDRRTMKPFRIRFSVYPPQEQQNIQKERQIRKAQLPEIKPRSIRLIEIRKERETDIQRKLDRLKGMAAAG